MDSTATPAHADGPSSGDPVLWRRPTFWLAAMVVAFFVASVYFGAVAYMDLQTQNATDAGIITQAVASTAGGHVAPFFESYDCMVKARCSFLLVHPSFALYVAVPFYLLASNTITLFAVRAAWVAAAAVPLYYLTRNVTRSSGKGLIAAGLFLVWAPGLIGDAFSLHLETLLPLELFTLALLWQTGRYRWGLLVALITFLTFEIFPLFTFLVGAFFLFPYLERPLAARWRRWRSAHGPRLALRERLVDWYRGVIRTLAYGEVRYSLALMAASVVAYIVLASFINIWGYQVLGVPPPGVAPGVTGVFTNPSSPATQSIATILKSRQTLSTGEYWLLLYALLGFIPLLSPRALILSVPWIGYTFLTDSDRFDSIGHQYSFIAAGPIFLGLAYGLIRVNLAPYRPAPTVAPDPVVASSVPALAKRWRPPSGRAVWGVALGAVVVANVVLLPVNPLLNAAHVDLGLPFEPDYFDHSLTVSPSYAWMEDLVALVPRSATVGAPSSIFPLVAGFPHAMVMIGSKQENFSDLPFNVSGGPDYVFMDPASTNQLPPSMIVNISNPAVYGIRGIVSSTPQGPVVLFARGYVGSPDVFGPSVVPVAATFTPGDGLIPGPKGVEQDNASAPSGKQIASPPNAYRTGLLWSGPGVLFAPGNYTVTFHVALAPETGTSNKSIALRLYAAGFGGVVLNESLPVSEFPSGSWTTLSYNVTLTRPLLNFDLQGYQMDARLWAAVSAVSVVPTGP
jgi:uncharacterized membrane protein